jgi:hypothetical protein
MKKFIKRKEDFVCAWCGYKNIGTGFTNHCIKCLYSKHVDINPGDRTAPCGGLMKPISVEKEGETIFIVHQCQTCKFIRRNKLSKEDNFNKIIEIMNCK